jgi:hypothetical protein
MLRGNLTIIGFEVIAAVVKNYSVFWDLTPCSPLKVGRLQGRRLYQTRNQPEEGSEVAEILGHIGNRRKVEAKQSVPVGSHIAPNKPIGEQEQITSSH